MKRLLLLLVCGLCVFLMISCQGSAVNKSKPDVVIKADGRFPQSLAGTWKASVGNWQLTLAPDGNVVSAVNASGLPMVMSEGGALQPGLTEKSYLYFVFGPAYADYNPVTRELNVTVIIENFRMQVDDAALEGKLKHYFTGPVSKDGKLWNVKLFNYAQLKGSAPLDPNTEEPEFLVFNKVQNNQPSPPANQ